MVRLVFRPYTHIRRTICTSVSLRASIRVSPDFTLRRHSSPSFGSYRTRSYSIHPTGSADAALMASLTFIPRDGFSTFTLACTLDSLVRVSRRAGKDFFDKIALSPSSHPPTNSPHASTLGFLPVDHSILPTPPGTALANLHLSPLDNILLYRFLLNGFRSFDILSKLLFIFPSQYLFAIGFPHIFSLRRSLSPT